MSAPSKPWEGLSHRPPVMSNGYIDELAYPQRPGGVPGPMAGPQPPPLPPRRSARQASTYGTAGGLYNGYGGGYGAGYGSYMSPFGSNLYGSSPYGMPFSPYRAGPFDSRYGQGAEDGQSPFQSVESVVRAISSLSMMMESTYQSMFMSFRAVMGVAENMERLRRVVIDLFGGIAIVKSVLWFFKKILYIMGLIKNNPSRERLWEAAAAEVVSAANSGPPEQTRRTWPLVAFFGLMLGGPYVLYKLIQPPEGSAEWDPKQDGGVKCVALYDFDTNQRGELPFRRGEVLLRQRTAQSGWALAVNKNGQRGYVPSDRLKPISVAQQKALLKQYAARHSQPNQQLVDSGPAASSSHNYGQPNISYVQLPTGVPLVDPSVIASASEPIVEPLEDVILPVDLSEQIDATIPFSESPQDPANPTNQPN